MMKSKGFCNIYSFLQKKYLKIFEMPKKAVDEINDTDNSC